MYKVIGLDLGVLLLKKAHCGKHMFHLDAAGDLEG